MIEEDLHVARERARRFDGLAERRRLIEMRIQQAQQASEIAGIPQPGVRRGDEGRLSSFYADQRALERELAEVGPAREVYEELLVRQERRVIASADPRGPELAEIARRLDSVEADLPAFVRARATAQALINAADSHACGFEAQLEAFAADLEALRVHAQQTPKSDDPPPMFIAREDVASRSIVGEGVTLWLMQTLNELSGRCIELSRVRDELLARREDLLVA